MKDIVTILLSKGYIYTKFEPIDIKSLGSRKKIQIYKGVDLKSYYWAVFVFKQKSRFVRKNVLELEQILKQMIIIQGHNIKKRVLIYDMPICSKAKQELKDSGWILIDVTL